MSRVAVVTGANRGIGKELVRQLTARGDTVVLGARNLQHGEHAARTLGALPGKVLVRRLDVTGQHDVDQLTEELTTTVGHVDVLVNNAAIHYDSWQAASSADLTIVTEAIETNLLGAWRVTLALLPLLRASHHPRIVNVSSEGGSLAGMGSGLPAYHTSKAALNALTRTLAAELRPEGFLVNAVCPGWVATDMGAPAADRWQTGPPASCGQLTSQITVPPAASSATVIPSPGSAEPTSA